MKLLFSILLFSQLSTASEFCTVLVNEDFHEFNKTYTLKVLNYSCTDGTQISFQNEVHESIDGWHEGHRKFSPAYTSKILKTVAAKGFQFRTSNNHEKTTTYFFHKQK